MLKISFSQNWNGKLMTDYHTTIRAAHPYYQVGTQAIEYLNGVEICQVKIVSRTDFKLEEITEQMALTDTGYSAEQATAMLRKMQHEYYLKHGPDAPLCLLVLQVEKRFTNTFYMLLKTAMQRFDKLLAVAEAAH